jgi:hypothetical protein
MAVTGQKLKAHYLTRGRKGSTPYAVTPTLPRTLPASIVPETRQLSGSGKSAKR